jgi:hypothetical protein
MNLVIVRDMVFFRMAKKFLYCINICALYTYFSSTKNTMSFDWVTEIIETLYFSCQHNVPCNETDKCRSNAFLTGKKNTMS